jgi:hypothetical protein
VIKLSDVHKQIEYIANHSYESYENPDKVREADMDYLFKLEEAYKSGKPIQWGSNDIENTLVRLRRGTEKLTEVSYDKH